MAKVANAVTAKARSPSWSQRCGGGLWHRDVATGCGEGRPELGGVSWGGGEQGRGVGGSKPDGAVACGCEPVARSEGARAVT